MVTRFKFGVIRCAAQIRLGCKTALHWLSCQGDNLSPAVERYGRVVGARIVQRGLSLQLDSGRRVTWAMYHSDAELIMELCGMVHHNDMEIEYTPVLFITSLSCKGLQLLIRVCSYFGQFGVYVRRVDCESKLGTLHLVKW